MRLIDADKLLKELDNFSMRITGSANAMALSVMYETKKSIAKMINEQPTLCDTKDIPDGMTFIFDEEMGTLYEVEADVWAKIKDGKKIKIK